MFTHLSANPFTYPSIHLPPSLHTDTHHPLARSLTAYVLTQPLRNLPTLPPNADIQYLLINQSTRLLIHSPSHPPTYLPSRPTHPAHPPIPPTLSLTHSLTHSLTETSTHSTNNQPHPPTPPHLVINPPIHLFTQLSTNPFTHPSIPLPPPSTQTYTTLSLTFLLIH